ncbi:hypothetical protein CC80DRAFT_574955 [Byssothecium circinans]|uniref:Uncharacterized protein n=1 Tax=Byssothecium circinans TaxID=147558 RepID=A0A6A5TG42_9PLEO|nr:hypothetical protein CC80DRAFT_574955 [Byssothecium circinans]
MPFIRMLLLLFLSLITHTAASPLTPAVIPSFTDRTNRDTSLTARDEPLCHFKVGLMKSCNSEGYSIRVFDITDPWGKNVEGVENQGRWLHNIEKGEVTIGKIAGIPMTATYFPREGDRIDQVLFIYPMQMWYDFDGHCSDRTPWAGDGWNGDLNHCPAKWYFYYRNFKCAMKCEFEKKSI